MSPNNPLAPKRNSSARIHDGPSSSFIMASQSMDCFAVRIPPAGLKPTAIPVCCAYSRMARTMTRLTGSVAFVGSLPVEVLMKSAPAIMATGVARARDSTAPQRTQRSLDKGVINAHRRHLDAQLLDPELVYVILLDGLPRLGAQS